MRAARALPTDLLTSRRADRLIAEETEALAEKYAQPGELERVIENIGDDPVELLAFQVALREAPSVLQVVRLINRQDSNNRKRRRLRLSRQRAAG